LHHNPPPGKMGNWGPDPAIAGQASLATPSSRAGCQPKRIQGEYWEKGKKYRRKQEEADSQGEKNIKQVLEQKAYKTVSAKKKKQLGLKKREEGGLGKDRGSRPRPFPPKSKKSRGSGWVQKRRSRKEASKQLKLFEKRAAIKT